MTAVCMLPLARVHRKALACVRLQSRGRRRSPVRCICMLRVCVASCMYVCVCLCACVCVFAAAPQYKRGHRKTASFGTILDVPKIVVTGISSWGNQRASSDRLAAACLAQSLGCWLLCADEVISRVSHAPHIGAKNEEKKKVNYR